MATTRAQRSRVVFLALIVAILYALISIGVGLATADACGDLGSPKSWRVAPPGWECHAA